jgi:Protein involved in cell division
MSEFGRSAQEQREYERARYPGTDVFKNKLGLHDARELERAELLYVTDRLTEGLPQGARRLDQGGLKAIHRHLFQDLYPWAGQFRTYTTGRGQAAFARPEYIEPTLRDLFAALRTEKNLAGLDQAAFASRAAHFVNEINAVHPFIEGNGRTQRVWLRNLADRAGYSIRLEARDKEAWYEASRRGFHGDNQPMAELITRSTQPLSREVQQQREIKKSMERDGVQEAPKGRGHRGGRER